MNVDVKIVSNKEELLNAARKAEDMEEFCVARWLRDWI